MFTKISIINISVPRYFPPIVCSITSENGLVLQKQKLLLTVKLEGNRTRMGQGPPGVIRGKAI